MNAVDALGYLSAEILSIMNLTVIISMCAFLASKKKLEIFNLLF